MLNWAYPDFTIASLGLALALVAAGSYVLRSRRLAWQLGQGAARLGWKLPLRLLVIIGLLTAWLGPSYGLSSQAVRMAGKDLWLLVDVSRSMDATDVAPSRLQRVQIELNNLIANFPADRLGLIVFGGEAYVQCPLTYDQGALQLFVATLQTGLLPKGATSLSKPLQVVASRQNNKNPTTPTIARTTAVVVWSDGEDFGENLEPTLRELAHNGTRVYAVGVGTTAGSTIPDAAGGYVQDGKSRVVRSRLQEAPLLELAAQTGGQYVELNDHQNGLPGLLTDLRTLPESATQTRTMAVTTNRYRYFLAAVLGLLLLDVLLTVTVIRP